MTKDINVLLSVLAHPVEEKTTAEHGERDARKLIEARDVLVGLGMPTVISVSFTACKAVTDEYLRAFFAPFKALYPDFKSLMFTFGVFDYRPIAQIAAEFWEEYGDG